MAKSTPYTQASQTLQTQAAAAPDAVLRTHKAFLEPRLKQISAWVRQGVSPEALVRFTLMEMQTNAKLRECSPMSIYLGLLSCAVTGLEPGALKGEAYLVPFARQAVFMPGWKGLVKQARRSREVTGLVANVVRQADTFDLDLGTANSVVHKPALGGARGDVIGVYAIASMHGAHREIEWMDAEDLGRIRRIAEARGKSPAWTDWPDQMQRKSVIRRLCKRLPLGADYFVALALEQAHDTGRPQAEVLDIETDGEATKAISAAEGAPRIADASAEAEAADRAIREREGAQ